MPKKEKVNTIPEDTVSLEVSDSIVEEEKKVSESQPGEFVAVNNVGVFNEVQEQFLTPEQIKERDEYNRQVEEYRKEQEAAAQRVKEEQEKIKSMRGFFYFIEEYDTLQLEIALESFANAIRETEYAQLIQATPYVNPLKNVIGAMIFYRAIERLH